MLIVHKFFLDRVTDGTIGLVDVSSKDDGQYYESHKESEGSNIKQPVSQDDLPALLDDFEAVDWMANSVYNISHLHVNKK